MIRSIILILVCIKCHPMQFVKDYISNSFNENIYTTRNLPPCVIRLNITINEKVIEAWSIKNLFWKNKSENNSSVSQPIFSLDDISTCLDSVYKRLLKDVSRNCSLKCLDHTSCFLIIKIKDTRYDSNFPARLKLYNTFINSIKENVDKLGHYNFHFIPLYDTVRFIDYKSSNRKIQENTLEILNENQPAFVIYIIKMPYFMISMVPMKNLSDEYFIEYFCRDYETYAKIPEEEETKQFIINEIIPSLMRNFNFFKLRYLCDKLKSDVGSLSVKDEEFNEIENINKSIYDSVDHSFNLTFEEHNSLINRCIRQDLIMRFVQIMILIRPDILREMFLSIISNINDYPIKFLFDYLVDINILTEEEGTLFLGSNPFVSIAFDENNFSEKIKKQLADLNTIKLSNNPESNRKLFALLYSL